VVRGADLLETTGRQLWLYDRLGLQAPRTWAHVPLMLGPDGSRLAKRHGAVTLEQRLAAGQSAGQVRAELLASVGLLDSASPARLPELAASFDWKSVRALNLGKMD
jgi:glutamyl-tRNA synthetase